MTSDIPTHAPPDCPLVLHVITARGIEEYISRPTHALLVAGAVGIGKKSLSRYCVARILNVDTTVTSDLINHPYIRTLAPVDAKAIPIEAVRNLQQFLSLRVPSSAAGSITRAVIIEDAHMLTTEAQNALLKTLEEPPLDTIVILTATSVESVLPTIQSRVRHLAVLPPPATGLSTYFEGHGYSKPAIDRALLLSGELPGLATALLSDDTEHPLVPATAKARQILQSTVYERLLVVDELSKQKQLSLNILYILAQMSRTALLRSTDVQSATRWRRIMSVTYQAQDQLAHNTQPKLVLTNMMLAL